MSAPQQYERRWNRTPSGCLCRASLIWQKELHFGPQTQPANKCSLLKGAICIRVRTHTQTNTKILPATEFTLHSIQFKYIYMQEINWKTDVYLPALCFPLFAIPIKPAQLRRMSPSTLLCHLFPFPLRDHTPKTNELMFLWMSWFFHPVS